MSSEVKKLADVTPEEMARRITEIASRQAFASSIDPIVSREKIVLYIHNELAAWREAILKGAEPQCDHPVEGCEVIMHKGAYAVLCSKCMCTSLVDQDVWEPFEEKDTSIVPGFRGE